MTPIQKAKEIAKSYADYLRAYNPSHWVDLWIETPGAQALLSGEDWKEDGVVRSEQEIRESLAEMERMATAAENVLNNPMVKETPVLLENFTKWKERSSARASILKWVLGLPYLDEPHPILPEPPKP